MSKITEPMLLDSTGKEIVEKLHTQNMLLNLMAGAAMEGTTSMAEIRKIVQAGKASEVYNIGDQIVVPWTDVATGQKYEAVGDIVHFGNVTLKDGEEVPGMFIQWHYATPFGVQFDNNEAFYTASEAELPAGTYNITVGANELIITPGSKIDDEPEYSPDEIRRRYLIDMDDTQEDE